MSTCSRSSVLAYACLLSRCGSMSPSPGTGARSLASMARRYRHSGLGQSPLCDRAITVLALLTTPGRPGTARVGAAPEPGGPGIRLRTLEVGVCGTDREITEGAFGI